MALYYPDILKSNNPDAYGIVDSLEVSGHNRVATLSDLYTLPTYVLSTSGNNTNNDAIGKIIYVTSEDKYYKLTSWSNRTSSDGWEIFNSGSGSNDGIPIYNQTMLDEKGDALPENYITIPDKETDLTGTTTSREIQQSGTYVDILFSAIRKLQSEVARLKNSFQYGINSYNDTNTLMSTVVDGYTDPDEEPLWCIEPEDLSLIYELEATTDLDPIENVNTDDVPVITGTVTWSQDLSEVTDPKLFLYLTTTSLNVQINLKSESGNIAIDLSTLNIQKSDSYNIMLCISRKVDNEGYNYIYMTIGSGQNSTIYKEGYYNGGSLQESRYDCGDSYYIESVTLTDLTLSNFKVYSKYQDFSEQVIPSAPTDQTYKYQAAHITIRSVESYTVLQSIQDQLPENELIFVEDTKKLYIKNNDKLINIGASSSSEEDTGMTQTEVINLLKEMGIVQEDNGNLDISDIASLTFIHEDTGTKYKFKVNSEGELVSTKVPEDSELLSSRANGLDLTSKNVRGFIGRLRLYEYNKTSSNKITVSQDARIYSDRLKIGAFYAPLESDTVFGCNRAFVELENTADCDFCLDGCYLHWTGVDSTNSQVVYHLPLTGTIKAGSTYLIVGKEYAEATDSNVYINVDSYDQEWFVDGELIDFTVKSTIPASSGYGFALTYGQSALTATTQLYTEAQSADLATIDTSLKTSKCPYLYEPYFIDAIYYSSMVLNASKKGYWAATAVAIKSNTMYKNMFELDPAKQAFQALTTIDSSRNRWNSTNDIWVMDLSKPYIQFPHSDETYSISNFAPKASYKNKNVSTDKSKLNTEKPNMVTCSFGLNLHTDRCFNWVSVGYYDEYVWLRKQGTTTWNKFESYNTITAANTAGTSYPHRKEYSVELNNAAYARVTGRFPGDNSFFTAHKCVLAVSEVVSASTTYEYVVGRADKDGNPDSEHTSDVQTFILYPTTYTPRVYHITDQQGFHWVEYQVWNAAANKVEEKIVADQKSENIIPVLINTGDMTQNGTRINEWLDYYNAGKNLFSKYEQMNVVGNNDLCNTDVTILGTGDDQGKSNSYFFYLFYCYDIDESVFVPIVNNKYIPSLYYFDSNSFRFIMVNSEITQVNCKEWFGLTDGTNTTNIYTGWTIGSNSTYDGSFTSIYTMLYNMLNTTKKCLVAMHEMPYTVITNESIASGQEGVYRSISKAGALVGSHCNQISNTDTGKGIYWFSRLLEYKGVKLCIGGHKHTYTCTYPLREYFLFDDGAKNSKDNYSDYTMESTLENDNVTWTSDGKNLTKFPLTKRSDVGAATTGFYPYTAVSDLTGGVTYFMCQATGYKLTSNKELPSANQKFSMLVPETTITSAGADKASTNQQYPMFAIINLGDSYTIKLARITNIFNSNHKFAQNTYATSDMSLEYLATNSTDNYGTWKSSEVIMTTI